MMREGSLLLETTCLVPVALVMTAEGGAAADNSMIMEIIVPGGGRNCEGVHTS
jgi:hypothetical protein